MRRGDIAKLFGGAVVGTYTTKHAWKFRTFLDLPAARKILDDNGITGEVLSANVQRANRRPLLYTDVIIKRTGKP